MKIEDAIKQSKPFKSEYQKLSVNLMFTFNWLNDILNSFFHNYDITLKQFNILRILKGAGKPVSTAFLTERLLDKRSDTSRIVDRMVLKGLVIKNACKVDKRLIDIVLTKKGQVLLEKINSEIDKIDNYLKSLDESEAVTLNNLLDKLRSED